MSGQSAITAVRCGADFSLAATLTSGQCFRWIDLADGRFSGLCGGRGAILSQNGSVVEITVDTANDAAEFWSHYLDLDTDYHAIRDETVALEPRLAEAAERCGGVHILNQDPWEALCSFIISQNNNIPRIRGIIARLCELCGVPAGECGRAFPTPEALAVLDEAALTAIGCGYRASYLIEGARAALDGRFDPAALRLMPIEQARQSLQAIRGVGPKVADCTLLFGLHRLDAFPRDVWIKRALAGEFRDTPLEHSRYAGVAQQYIFEYIRAAGNAE